MSTEKFRDTKFRAEALAKIEQMNTIIEEYQEQGLRMTARQLYYQFVSRDLIPNLPAEYKKLTALLTDARYAGMVDWQAIEDRGREPTQWQEWSSIEGLVRATIRNFRLPRWDGQEHYVELWVEKQALAGVLEPVAAEFHVTLMVNKGYSSASAMKESADRIVQATADHDQHKTILYLGDFDPSGEDMVRDIGDRLAEFGVDNLAVDKVALTKAQIKKYRPPPNPAKLTDPRAGAYIAEHGNKSWELDALPPDVLTKLLRIEFAGLIDQPVMDAIKAREERDKRRLLTAVAKIK